MWRAWAVFTFFVIGLALVVARLFYWQIIAGDRLRRVAASQYFVAFPLPATRGAILASDGSPLVLNQPAFLIFAEPHAVKEITAFAGSVGEILGLEAGKLTEALTVPGRVWVPIAHKVELETVNKLKSLNLAGLGFEKEPKRLYPEASTAVHLLGFVGSDSQGRDTGYFGLEGYYNRQLAGVDGSLQLEKDAKGAPILIGEVSRIVPQDGRSLVLWVDTAVQSIVERRLLEGIHKYGAKEGTVTIMDPKTGGILAMAAYPNYHPGLFSQFDKLLYQNPIVASSYEPGSTFKALIMAAALEEKLVTPTTTMDEQGPVVVGPHAIRTWNNQYHGTITMTQVLEYSSNVGMVFVAQKLGKEKMVSAMARFGLGEPTGIDLEEEASPELRPEKEWQEIDILTTSFGQGIAVTPVQMVGAVAALANEGKLMEPHIVKEIKDGRRTISVKPKVVREVVSPATARIITEMLVNAVDGGEAKWAKPKGYRIAGKTGTAQIPVAGHYDEEKTIASFVGYAPADKPRFVMLVTLREPTSSPWGSETAAPLFFAIARDLFTYWGIPPQ